ncbi:MAG: M15 family metallopeptidase [Spirochaetales bacterium]|nr:M15 family metallopeptidase [Spirochaetales bacterium]
MVRNKLPAILLLFALLSCGATLFLVFADDSQARAARQLSTAYPDFIITVENNSVIWKDKTVTLFDDGKTGKTWLETLNSPDLQDQLALPYPKKYTLPFLPGKNEDPGRIRNEEFFKKMYGSTKKEIESHLAAIRWMPLVSNEVVYVTTVNNIDKKLMQVSAELEKLPSQYRKYITRIGGTYNYRFIKDSKRLSMHSFGIAIDMNVDNSEYWNWDYNNELDDIVYRNRMPYEIAAIFEKYGFIWGGKWYHYDTMHFEYRPELLVEIK